MQCHENIFTMKMSRSTVNECSLREESSNCCQSPPALHQSDSPLTMAQFNWVVKSRILAFWLVSLLVRSLAVIWRTVSTLHTRLSLNSSAFLTTTGLPVTWKILDTFTPPFNSCSHIYCVCSRLLNLFFSRKVSMCLAFLHFRRMNFFLYSLF